MTSPTSAPAHTRAQPVPIGVPASAIAQALPRIVLLIGVAASALLLWSRRSYVPIWDGRIYADCVMRAAADPLTLAGYRCAGHVSQSYVALLVIAQRLAPTSFAPMLAVNALLLGLSALALHRLLRQVFPDPSHQLGTAAVVAAFLVHPIVLASAVQPGLDFGVLVFSLCALAALLEGRRWAVVVFGVLLVFSKEPGVLVYGVIALLYLWRYGLRKLMPNAPYWLAAGAMGLAALLNAGEGHFQSALLCLGGLGVLGLRKLEPTRPPFGAAVKAAIAQWPLAIPVASIGLYIGVNALRNAQVRAAAADAAPLVWGGDGSAHLIRTIFRAGIADHSTLAALALMLVVGFLWLPTLVMAADLGVGIVRRRAQHAARAMPGVDGAALGIVTAALICEIWFLSRYVTYANARYFLPLYPLVLVVAYAALVRLGVTRAVRAAGFAGLALLFCISALRTVDPVSRRLWGTFPVGDRTLLRMTSLTGECCGYGRDQLVYNLEFTEFDALESAAYAQLRPTRATTFVVPMFGDWYTVGQLDQSTLHRTLRRDSIVEPRVLNAYVATMPEWWVGEGWYLEMPYVNDAWSLAKVAEFYEIGPPTYVAHDGYRMAVRRLRLRNDAQSRLAGDGPGAPSHALSLVGANTSSSAAGSHSEP
jgi:hypothetical protein